MTSRIVILLTVISTSCLYGVAGDSYLTDEDWKITFTNEFKFQLKDVEDSPAVKQAAHKLGFVYNSQIVAEFFLYTRDDVPRYSAVQYDVTSLKNAQKALAKYVILIEQDYMRQWKADALNISLSEDDRYARPTAGEKRMFPTGYSGASPPDTICERKSVNVAFIDMGFQMTHPKLIEAANFLLSHSFYGDWSDTLPQLYEEDAKDALPANYYEKISHGTRCMGRVGARAGAGCDAGVAPNVKLVGLKAIDISYGLSDMREAEALSYKHDEIGVFSCSYGVRDNSGFHKPGTVTQAALKTGASNSRDCLGVVYVYPSGNGHLDNCNADGYANSVDTITIAYVNRKGHLPSNVEVCTAIIAATVGEGYNTTDLNDVCSGEFKGSSASTAVAAGYAGELLYLRPCLSKRDIEHIMVRTAIPVLHEDISWRTNGAGLKFNDQVGFGQLDLKLMKAAAETWSLVPERHVCEILIPDPGKQHIVGTNWILKTPIPSTGCRDSENSVQYLEHVQVALDLRCSNISQVAIQLVSPAGTASNILTHINMTAGRVRKYSNLSWTFMSVNFWGEPANGLWVVKVIVDDTFTEVKCEYTVNKLVLYGTETDPQLGGGHTSCKQGVQAEDKHGSLSGGLTAGIVAAVALIAVVTLIAVALSRYFRRKNANSHAQVSYQAASNNETTEGSNICDGQNSLPVTISNNSSHEATASNYMRQNSTYSNKSFHDGD